MSADLWPQFERGLREAIGMAAKRYECRECGWIGMIHETDHELCPECGGELVCEDDDDDRDE